MQCRGYQLFLSNTLKIQSAKIEKYNNYNVVQNWNPVDVESTSKQPQYGRINCAKVTVEIIINLLRIIKAIRKDRKVCNGVDSAPLKENIWNPNQVF